MIASVDCPCKGCQDRAVGCHSSCDAYTEYTNELTKVRLKIFREHEHDKYFNQAKRRSMERARK